MNSGELPHVVTFNSGQGCDLSDRKRGTQRVMRDLFTQKHTVDIARACRNHVQTCERVNHRLCITNLCCCVHNGTRAFTKHRWHWALCTTDAINCFKEVSKPATAISGTIPWEKRHTQECQKHRSRTTHRWVASVPLNILKRNSPKSFITLQRHGVGVETVTQQTRTSLEQKRN